MCVCIYIYIYIYIYIFRLKKIFIVLSKDLGNMVSNRSQKPEVQNFLTENQKNKKKA